MKVLGMGNALVDVLVRIEDDSILKQWGLPKGSMTLIDEPTFEALSKEFEKMNTSIVSGGSASNTVVGLANLGINSGFIGRIGDDFYGNLYEKDLINYHVCPHLIKVGETSGVASTFISKDGERTFGTYLGAAALLNADNLTIEDFIGYNYFYIEGYLVQSYALIERAIELAKKAGLQIVLDLASYNIVEANKEFLLSIIPQSVDIVFANEEEAQTLTGLAPEGAVSKIAQITNIAIVKAGAKGSWIQKGNEKVAVPANKVDCIDTTGAGDLYAAGFIYGLILNKSLKMCGQIGTLLAGEVVQNIGPKIKEERWSAIKAGIANI